MLLSPNVFAQVPSTLTVNVEIAPSYDTGKFNISIDGNTVATDLGNGTTGTVSVPLGSVAVSETAGSNTDPSNYLKIYSCSDGSIGNGTDFTINILVGQSYTCTFSNTSQINLPNTPTPTETPTPAPTLPAPTVASNTPTPTSTQSSSSSSNNYPTNTPTPASSNTACYSTKPGSAPYITSAAAGKNSVTLIWSEAASPVSYYLVAYGLSSGSLAFGNPDVGGAGTTSYTISGLSGGTKYYFRVRAGNGCAPGDYSNEVSATPGGVLLTTPAAGFTQDVLGEATSSGLPKVNFSSPPQVLGAGTTTNKQEDNFFLKYKWYLLFLLLIHVIIYLYYTKKIPDLKNIFLKKVVK